jgi:hypothetical protein
LCRGLCRARPDEEVITFKSRSLDNSPANQGGRKLPRARALHRLSKRVLDNLDEDQVEDFIVQRFNFEQTFDFIDVYDEFTGKYNSAKFLELHDGQVKFEIGAEGLCGCTVVVVVSQEAVWFAHLL